MTFAYSLRFLSVFWGPLKVENPDVHRPPVSFWLPITPLVLGVLGFGLLPITATWLTNLAARTLGFEAHDLYLWHGFSLVRVGLSVLTWAGRLCHLLVSSEFYPGTGGAYAFMERQYDLLRLTFRLRTPLALRHQSHAEHELRQSRALDLAAVRCGGAALRPTLPVHADAGAQSGAARVHRPLTARRFGRTGFAHLKNAPQRPDLFWAWRGFPHRPSS